MLLPMLLLFKTWHSSVVSLSACQQFYSELKSWSTWSASIWTHSTLLLRWAFNAFIHSKIMLFVHLDIYYDTTYVALQLILVAHRSITS